MSANNRRTIISLVAGFGAIFMFSSCSNVDFAEKPVAQCNGSSLTCSSAVENGRKINIYDYDHTVPLPKADILFVVDNSKSMGPEQIKLAGAFNNFASALVDIDWQLGITTTDMTTSGAGGRLVDISTTAGTVKLLTPQIPNYESAFYSAISGQGETGSNDERGILSALRNIEGGHQSGLIREKSHLAVILLSDEDERSMGGSVTGLELSTEEAPRYYVDRVNNILSGGAHSFYSIIIRPNDSQCFNSQKSQSYQGYYGQKYFETQKLIAKELYGKEIDPSSPEVGNICDSSYFSIMSQISETLKSRIEPITLPCDPIADSTTGRKVTVTPDQSHAVEGRQVVFSPALAPGQSIHLSYKCYAN